MVFSSCNTHKIIKQSERAEHSGNSTNAKAEM